MGLARVLFFHIRSADIVGQLCQALHRPGIQCLMKASLHMGARTMTSDVCTS